ncbi:hypothetical protein EDC01DRAFT_285591 [Geopyxis carbonaria]|nr:hypothetical protein EDC01DRAFT_285591 [Geopyxis carbonaria]
MTFLSYLIPSTDGWIGGAMFTCAVFLFYGPSSIDLMGSTILFAALVLLYVVHEMRAAAAASAVVASPLGQIEPVHTGSWVPPTLRRENAFYFENTRSPMARHRNKVNAALSGPNIHR